jgi:spermidine/putrescine transport system substrate-binding protein
MSAEERRVGCNDGRDRRGATLTEQGRRGGHGPRSSAQKIARAALGLRRRTFLALGGAAVAAGTGALGIIHRQERRELRILGRPDQLPDPVISTFERASGIKLTVTPFSQNEQQIAMLQAARGEGFDLCQPSRDRAPQFRNLGLLAPFDLDRLPNSANLIPSMLEGSIGFWSWDRGLHHLPHCWGTEAISWRSDKTAIEYKDLSFGTLWEDQYRGRIQGRPEALLLGIGLWFDRTGRLPSNRMLDAYENEDSMKSIYDVILKFAIERRHWVRQLWTSADEASAGLTEQDCVVGKTWDGPALRLKKDGWPVRYMAPQEGAITWLDGWAMTKAAKNVEEAHEFLNYVMTPEISAQIAEGSGYNPVVAGAAARLSEDSKKNFAEAYPEDAMQKLWHRPPEPAWFASLRAQYSETFRSAVQGTAWMV